MIEEASSLAVYVSWPAHSLELIGLCAVTCCEKAITLSAQLRYLYMILLPPLTVGKNYTIVLQSMIMQL
jgi:hypothetical protein